MAASPEIPELAALKAALESHEAARDKVERAAHQVSSFADQETVAVLDAALTVSQGRNPSLAADEIRTAADQTVRKTELLLGEVGRFLSLPPANSSDEPNAT